MYLLQRSVIIPLRFGILNQSRTSEAPKLIQLSNTRTFLLPGKSSKMEKVERKFRLKDKMPPTSTLIYNNPSAFWIEPFFHFQNICIILGCGKLIDFVIKYSRGDVKFPLQFNEFIISKSVKEVACFVGVTFFVMVASSFGCKFTALRVYYDRSEKVNKAVLVGYLPFLRRVIDIKPKTVTPVIRRFPIANFKTFEFKADGRRMFFYEDYFRRPEDFNRMLKYYY